jgi:hypothetical protein
MLATSCLIYGRICHHTRSFGRVDSSDANLNRKQLPSQNSHLFDQHFSLDFITRAAALEFISQAAALESMTPASAHKIAN